MKKRKKRDLKGYFHSVNNEKNPAINIIIIANHIRYQVNIGNSRKIIKKTRPKPTSDPPLACCLLTIFSPPFILINKYYWQNKPHNNLKLFLSTIRLCH